MLQRMWPRHLKQLVCANLNLIVSQWVIFGKVVAMQLIRLK